MKMDKKAMENVDGFLSKAGVFRVTTVDGDRPRACPFWLYIMIDYGICFSVSDFKDAYRQTVATPTSRS